MNKYALPNLALIESVSASHMVSLP